MKLIFILLLLSFSIFAQKNKEGVILYHVMQSINLKNIEKNDTLSQEIKNGFKKLSKNIEKAAKAAKFELTFNATESFFKMQDVMESDNHSFGYKMLNKGNFYVDLKGDVLNQKESLGSTYIIINPINNQNWQLTNESKIVNGHTCFKAINTKVTENKFGKFYKKVIAWYAPDIPLRFGPEGFGNLPGLIVSLSIEKENTYTLNKITYKKVAVKKLSKGKKVTLEQYNQIARKAFENMVESR